MKLKTICGLLLCVLFLLLLNEIGCIANYHHHHQENFINDEDRRAADHIKSETHKRGLYDTSGIHNKEHTYPSGYNDPGTFTNPGYSYSPSAVSHYYPTGHNSYGSFGQSGYGHSAPAQSYGHGGYKALALKGLLIPLAGIALLGAAAALSTNPVLLQLGVVNGRRRRRSISNSHQFQLK